MAGFSSRGYGGSLEMPRHANISYLRCVDLMESIICLRKKPQWGFQLVLHLVMKAALMKSSIRTRTLLPA